MAKRKVAFGSKDIAASPWDVGGVGSGAAAALLGATRRSGGQAGSKAVAASRAGGRLTELLLGGKKKRSSSKRGRGRKTASVKKTIRKHLSAVKHQISKLHER